MILSVSHIRCQRYPIGRGSQCNPHALADSVWIEEIFVGLSAVVYTPSRCRNKRSLVDVLVEVHCLTCMRMKLLEITGHVYRIVDGLLCGSANISATYLEAPFEIPVGAMNNCRTLLRLPEESGFLESIVDNAEPMFVAAIDCGYGNSAF